TLELEEEAAAVEAAKGPSQANSDDHADEGDGDDMQGGDSDASPSI
ncbi:hypothetical protein A2U01_0110175, partial [Trifolium medium]|nr:hypothetical protein [Trifolium medium]